MEVEHEVDEAADEAGAEACEEGEAAAGELGSGPEVDDAEAPGQVPVGQWLEVEGAGLAPGVALDVGVGCGALGCGVGGAVGHGEEHGVEAGVEVVELGFEALDALGELA